MLHHNPGDEEQQLWLESAIGKSHGQKEADEGQGNRCHAADV